MFFVYLFLFSIFFTFSSDKLQIEWRGLKIDLSACSMISHPVNEMGFDAKAVFKNFQLPSKKSKSRKYLNKLFNTQFSYADTKISLLMALVLDRNALGFSEDTYLGPLLRECITRKFCKALPVADLEKLKFFKDIRYLCFEYLKKNMVTCSELLPKFFNSIKESHNAIRSSSEWNELIDSEHGEYFLNALKDKNCEALYLDALSPKVFSLFLTKRYPSVIKVVISNCEINETLFELQNILNSVKSITLKNCHNLKIGNNDEERNDIMLKYIFDLNYTVGNYLLVEDCSLDQISLEQCKNFGHQESMRHFASQISLLVMFSYVCCTMQIDSLCLAGLSVSMLFMSKLFVSGRHDLLYFLCVLRIAHDLIPILLKEHFIFPFRCFSAFIMIFSLMLSFYIEYDNCRLNMKYLKKNPFGILTKYRFFDTLCRLYFWI